MMKQIKPILLLLLAIPLLVMDAAPAFAISDSDAHSIYNDTVWYRVGLESGCANLLEGKDNIEKVWNYFIGKGLTAEGTAVIVGNFYWESGGMKTDNPDPLSGANGLAHWLGSRLDGLYAFAHQRGGDWRDLGIQLDYAWMELTGGYRESLGILKRTTSESDIPNAVVAFEKSYEKSGDTGSYDDRIGLAMKFFKQYGGGAGSSGGSDCSAGGLVWPFATKSTSQYNRVDQGWDIQDHATAPIYAIAPGTIHLSAPNPGGFGNDYPYEELDNTIGGPTKTVYYGHVHVLTSVLNQHVVAGQKIAISNTTNVENGSNAYPGWLEIGFSLAGTGAPVDHCVGTSQTNCLPTPAGQKMKSILINAQPAPRE